MTLRQSVPLAALALAGCLSASSPALADTNTPLPSTTGKGIAAGILLGGEAVTLTEAALDVQPAWAYIVGGLAGGAAGGVGGYYLEQSASPKTTMLLLAGGMLLVIPTAVAILSATAYEPPEGYVQDTGPVDEPLAEPAAPDSALPPVDDSNIAPTTEPGPVGRASTQRRRISLRPPVPVAPPSLLGLDRGQLTLSVPAIELRDVYAPDELLQYGFEQDTELRVPVFGLVF